MGGLRRARSGCVSLSAFFIIGMDGSNMHFVQQITTLIKWMNVLRNIIDYFRTTTQNSTFLAHFKSYTHSFELRLLTKKSSFLAIVGPFHSSGSQHRRFAAKEMR